MRRQQPPTVLKTFADRAVKRHCRAAITWLRARDPACTVLSPDAFDQAAGNLRAVQYATGLTPAQVCDALRIHGWRRRGVLPQSTMNYRFRMTKAAAVAARTSGRKRHEDGPSADQIAARPTRRQALYRPRDAIDDPLAP